MTPEELQKIREELIGLADKITAIKNTDYASANADGTPRDVLKGFKDGFEDTKMEPLDVWLVHATKQFQAIKAFTKNPDKELSEPIEGRLADLINYAVFCLALARDRKKVSKSQLDIFYEQEYRPGGIRS